MSPGPRPERLTPRSPAAQPSAHGDLLASLQLAAQWLREPERSATIPAPLSLVAVQARFLRAAVDGYVERWLPTGAVVQALEDPAALPAVGEAGRLQLFLAGGVRQESVRVVAVDRERGCLEVEADRSAPGGPGLIAIHRWYGLAG